MRLLLLNLILLLLFTQIISLSSTVGYKIGNVDSYTLLRSSNKSNLFRVNDNQIQDGNKILLLELVGTHYQAGYDYGAILAKQILQTYNTFLSSSFNSAYQIKILQAFLDWQFDSYVKKNIPIDFLDQMRGVQDGARDAHGIRNIRLRIQRTLTIASYPGNFTSDIAYTLLDQFLRDSLHGNKLMLNYVEKNLFQVLKMIKQFHNSKRVHCSFFALWGNRTVGGKLMTMRNLDWAQDTGMNKYKLITVWKINEKIPHATLGFPGVIGALTGMSAAGITVHQAGLDSMRATQIGFPWTLRLRYIMMNAANLKVAKELWNQTDNTLGMNHMIASAVDTVTGEPAFVVETMRDYTAWFKDNDIREKEVQFVDPQSGKKFRAGFAMEEAVFRTNHAYDPKINWYRTKLPTQHESTIRRYLYMKDAIKYYEDGKQAINDEEALNITAIVAHKGGKDAYKCPGPADKGTNVISVMFVPGQMRMYVGFQYGSKETYKTGCCGVYVDMHMRLWFGNSSLQEKLSFKGNSLQGY